MKNILVQRNGVEYGPYSIASTLSALESGKLLLHDLARDADDLTSSFDSLRLLLIRHNIPIPKSLGILRIEQMKRDVSSIAWGIIFPWNELKSCNWLNDKKLLYLSFVGLLPMFAMAVLPTGWTGYWAIALYFSALWSIYFYYLFKTPQVEARLCPTIFFITGLGSILVLTCLQIMPPWTWLYALSKSKYILPRFIGMFFSVGLNEEICKAAILFWIVRRPGKLLMPQTVVFYGLISGLGFGIYEGVTYQMTVNRAAGVDVAYFLNIARLTSLPFFHAILTGIAGYYISYAALYPNKRYSLTLLAICVPALLHTVYNTFGWNLLGLASVFFSILLLMTYLSNCRTLQKKCTET
ncbi:MAG: PrsW family intramembrane metalloprotease [Verrucomicrobiae bacterium]|nr:PrsW family intramembrane metalloprotease [Verrucomicrobiae bacterium]